MIMSFLKTYNIFSRRGGSLWVDFWVGLAAPFVVAAGAQLAELELDSQAGKTACLT